MSELERVRERKRERDQYREEQEQCEVTLLAVNKVIGAVLQRRVQPPAPREGQTVGMLSQRGDSDVKHSGRGDVIAYAILKCAESYRALTVFLLLLFSHL